MNKLGSKLLPISCICCIYKDTILKELILAIDSILIQDYVPNELVIIVDGFISKDMRSFLSFILSSGDIFKVFYLEKHLGNTLNFSKKPNQDRLK